MAAAARVLAPVQPKAEIDVVITEWFEIAEDGYGMVMEIDVIELPAAVAPERAVAIATAL